MTTLYYTQLFTAGTLKGLTYTGSMSFVDEKSAQKWVETGRKGIKKPLGGSPYKIVDASFQKYARD